MRLEMALPLRMGLMEAALATETRRAIERDNFIVMVQMTDLGST
jgi:hypothetical protein